MLPPRFPNSGIRAKVFMQKIGLKVCVIKLNRIESFYAFLLHFCNKRNKDRGQPAMARPYAGVADHGLATCTRATDCSQGPLQRSDRLRPRPLAKGRLDAARASPQGLSPIVAAAACGHNHLQRGARKERPPATSPQGTTLA
ncbi:hypothetical protein GW17_00046910 [Ensete ventricosum]|nr:hypothetical protein GW17_00046910 [Ensete ventricosum]